MVQDKLYDYTEYDWYTDEYDSFFENFTERTGLWHEAYTKDAKGRRLWAVEFGLYNPRYVYFKCGCGDWTTFLALHGLTEKYPLVLRYHQYGQGEDIRVNTEAAGYRNYSCGFNLEYDDANVSWQWNSDLDESTLEMMNDWLYAEIAELLEFVKDLIRAEFDTLLANLDSEYEYLCSEEYVRETLRDTHDDDELLQWAVENDEVVHLTWKAQHCNLTACQYNGV
jgi:hypothetical protein